MLSEILSETWFWDSILIAFTKYDIQLQKCGLAYCHSTRQSFLFQFY